jgi:hypothetical protein
LWLRRWRFSPSSSFFDEQRNEVNQIDRVEDFNIRQGFCLIELKETKHLAITDHGKSQPQQ